MEHPDRPHGQGGDSNKAAQNGLMPQQGSMTGITAGLA